MVFWCKFHILIATNPSVKELFFIKLKFLRNNESELCNANVKKYR